MSYVVWIVLGVGVVGLVLLCSKGARRSTAGDNSPITSNTEDDEE